MTKCTEFVKENNPTRLRTQVIPYHAYSIILPNPCASRLVLVVFGGFTFEVHGQLAVES